ncbi:heme oxygenase [Paenibacillus crassostreae]|uniref:Heme-degrading monooxygenase IsdG n=1 Tax=Paenibacillus crassostreae TaxID=1763538 RepID=A0A167BAI0_9BACL|nr:heme oxygenase [Paenibacillus crassostreae]AOZ93024.1 heme-degrading monooxygenase IsdG [Paenibacillus crassostreae]OAB71888.1 heme-degrading monooxygenase IsdG [Paenibacillus crassostreae]
MIVVTNRIKVTKGMGAAMAPRFTAPGPLDSSKGIIKVEVLLTQNLEEYDELNVNMYWESQDDFMAWRNSDAFKASHKRPEPDSAEAKKASPILGSEMITYEVATTREISQ